MFVMADGAIQMRSEDLIVRLSKAMFRGASVILSPDDVDSPSGTLPHGEEDPLVSSYAAAEIVWKIGSLVADQKQTVKTRE